MKSEYFYKRAVSYTHIGELMPYLNKGNLTLKQISKKVNMTYSNISKVMNDAYIEGIVYRERNCNGWYFSLTPKGKALSELCFGIKLVIENWEGHKTINNLNNLKFTTEEN